MPEALWGITRPCTRGASSSQPHGANEALHVMSSATFVVIVLIVCLFHCLSAKVVHLSCPSNDQVQRLASLGRCNPGRGPRTIPGAFSAPRLHAADLPQRFVPLNAIPLGPSPTFSGRCKSRKSFHRVRRGERLLRPRSFHRWGPWSRIPIPSWSCSFIGADCLMRDGALPVRCNRDGSHVLGLHSPAGR